MRFYSFTLLVGAVAALSQTGCGDDRFGTLKFVGDAPAYYGEGPQLEAHAVEGYVTALAGNGLGVVVGTASGAHEATTDGLSPLEVWSDDPEVSPNPGAVRWLERRDNTVLMLSTPPAQGEAGQAQGLFHTYGGKLVPSPAAAALSGLEVRALHSYSDSELWLATNEGLARLNGDKLESVAIGDEDNAASAVLRSGEVVYAAFGTRVYELDLVDNRAYRVPYDMGAVRVIRAGGAGAVYFASDRGLFERAADGGYTHYTMGGADGVTVYDAAHYPKDGLFVLLDVGVALVVPGEIPVGALELAGPGARPLAVDDVGRAWVGDGDTLWTAQLGTPISFAEDVAPILVAHCAGCHGDGSQGAPTQPFEDYDTVSSLGSTIVTRIADGEMPPSGNAPVSADDFDIIYRWLLSGQNP